MKNTNVLLKMPCMQVRLITLILLTFLLMNVTANAMQSNLAWPWKDGCSGPKNAFIAVFCPTSETFLFEQEKEIDLLIQSGLRSQALNWSLHRNGLTKPFREGQATPVIGNRYRIKVETSGLIPGFYDVHLALETGMPKSRKGFFETRPATAIFTIGWQVDKMMIPDTRPKNFKAFWDKAIAEVNAIALDEKIEDPMKRFDTQAINEYNVKSAALPADYDPEGHKVETVESCKVSFAGPEGPAGNRVYGWLAKPLGEGPFPAMLVLPGAGFNARPRPLEHARHGYLALDIQIHGQDVDLDKYPQLPGYDSLMATETDPDKVYFKNVYQRVIQAINYLESRPDVDTSRIVVVGGSQGGRLTTVAAGLDKRVKAAIPAIVHGGNVPYTRWAMWCNGLRDAKEKPWAPEVKAREKSDGTKTEQIPVHIEQLGTKAMDYYDVMNFAPDITCPIRFAAGLSDQISMATGVWSIYNRIPGNNKEIHPVPAHGHDWFAEHDRQAWKWLDGILSSVN